MKKATDIIREKEIWMAETATIIEDRIFKMLEKEVEENEVEFWEKQFIPIQYCAIEEIEQEVFEEKGQKKFKEKCPNIENKILGIVFLNLKKKLKETGFKLGMKINTREFGIWALDDCKMELFEIGENLCKKNENFKKIIVKEQENGGLSIEQ